MIPMSEIEKLIVKDGDEEYEIYVESKKLAEVPDDEPGYRDNLPAVDLQKVHNTIRGYAKYAIGAFVNFGLAEIEEMSLEFNLKIAGKAGLPILAETSTEGSFKIQVKCKFPGKPAHQQ
jgi:Trypsin-co-occurring domain 1